MERTCGLHCRLMCGAGTSLPRRRELGHKARVLAVDRHSSLRARLCKRRLAAVRAVPTEENTVDRSEDGELEIEKQIVRPLRDLKRPTLKPTIG